MTKKEAKAELKQILTQKTVSIPRLKKVLEILDYEEMEQGYISAAKTIKRNRNQINRLNKRVFRQRINIKNLESRVK